MVHKEIKAMAGAGFDGGQNRVNAKERNNRRSEAAKGTSARTPRKSGATSGFASNKRKGGGIFRPLKGGNSALG
jgi:hypothetical protein